MPVTIISRPEPPRFTSSAYSLVRRYFNCQFAAAIVLTHSVVVKPVQLPFTVYQVRGDEALELAAALEELGFKVEVE